MYMYIRRGGGPRGGKFRGGGGLLTEVFSRGSE